MELDDSATNGTVALRYVAPDRLQLVTNDPRMHTTAMVEEQLELLGPWQLRGGTDLWVTRLLPPQ